MLEGGIAQALRDTGLAVSFRTAFLGVARRIPGVPEIAGVQAIHNHEKIRKTFPTCMPSLFRSCIQDCAQLVLVGQMAQGTPLSLPS